MGLEVEQFPCLSDNYGFLIRDQHSGMVASIDSPDADTISKKLDQLGWSRLDYVFNTHWHPDHAGGNLALKSRFNCALWGPAEVEKIAPLDRILKPGEVINLGETQFDVLDLSGHTLGLIGFHSPLDRLIFVGDCIFALGCGRLFEGTPNMMWSAFERLMAFNPATKLYCAHEYTLSNLAFAQSVTDHEALKARAITIKAQRAQGLPTVPTTIGDEIETNPFLYLPLLESDRDRQIAKFAELRVAKDHF